MANSNDGSRVELTPWDLRLLSVDPIQKGLFFYKPESTPQEFEETFINHLKKSLSLALDFFPPLAGRLVQIKNDDTNTSHFIVDCNNAGASFTHAIAHGVHARDILEPVHTPTIVHSFFSPNGLRNYDGITNPLLGVQVTELVDAFFIACTINHCVVDGTSWHFFNSWSEISRGSSEISKLPLFERSSINELPFINYPIPVPPFELINLRENMSQPSCIERMFHFGKSGLSELKARANREAGSDKISTLQALLAHKWRAMIRSRGVVQPADNLQFCVVIIGTRGRLALPDTYFGNAIYFTFVIILSKNLVEGELGCVALEMNKVVSMQTRDHILQEIGKDVEVLRTDPELLKQTVLIGSTPRHNVLSVDFGLGKPVAVRSGPAASLME